MSEANDILIKTYRMRAFLIGETLENEQGLFFCTNELPEGCKLFTFALKNAKNEDIFDLKIPSAVANYYYFETDYVNHIKETKKMEDFFAEHPDAKVDKEKKEWKKFDEI